MEVSYSAKRDALAERMNRTMKVEFGLDGLVNTKQKVKELSKKLLI